MAINSKSSKELNFCLGCPNLPLEHHFSIGHTYNKGDVGLSSSSLSFCNPNPFQPVLIWDFFFFSPSNLWHRLWEKWWKERLKNFWFQEKSFLLFHVVFYMTLWLLRKWGFLLASSENRICLPLFFGQWFPSTELSMLWNFCLAKCGSFFNFFLGNLISSY